MVPLGPLHLDTIGLMRLVGCSSRGYHEQENN